MRVIVAMVGLLLLLSVVACDAEQTNTKLATSTETSDLEDAGLPSNAGLPKSLIEIKKDADLKLYEWDSNERQRLSTYSLNLSGLMLLPVDALSPLTIWNESNRTHQYGQKATIFEIRRAAYFTALMAADCSAVRAADISDSNGATPSDAAGLRHPVGAHLNGYSADLSYACFEKSSGDYRGLAWTFYSLLESAYVASILTAYKSEALALITDWYNKGIVEYEAVVRFTNDLWQDTTLNHDYHMHVNSTTREGLFTDPSNSYYRCYSAQVTSVGTIWKRISC